jgi:hypothetical protein
VREKRWFFSLFPYVNNRGAPMKKPVLVLVFQGLFELTGLFAFLMGYFAGITSLMLFGGILVVLDDVIEIFMGILNPLFPVLLAIVLAIVFTPWYVGVFWASTAFKVLGIPGSFRKIFAPYKLIEEVEHQRRFL